jgi:hypothetical protein
VYPQILFVGSSTFAPLDKKPIEILSLPTLSLNASPDPLCPVLISIGNPASVNTSLKLLSLFATSPSSFLTAVNNELITEVEPLVLTNVSFCPGYVVLNSVTNAVAAPLFPAKGTLFCPESANGNKS